MVFLPYAVGWCRGVHAAGVRAAHVVKTATRRGTVGTALVWALAIVLLFAQFLGQTHRVAHGQAAAGSHGQAVELYQSRDRGYAQTEVHAEPHSHTARAVFALLFSSHEGDSDECRALDQLSHFDAMPGVALLALPLVIQPFVLSVLPGLAAARWHALFQARGPPSLR